MPSTHELRSDDDWRSQGEGSVATGSEVVVKIEDGPSAGTRGKRRATHAPNEEQTLFTTYFRWTKKQKRSRPENHGKQNARRKTRRMVCNFCKQDEPYNTFRIQDHASKCKEYARARQVGKDFRHDLSVITHDSAPQSSIDELKYQLLNQFDVLRSERFERIQSMRDTLVADYMHFWQQYQDWRQVAEGKITQLRESGRPEDAQRLARVLLSTKFDYGRFELMYQVPLGEEVLKITGLNSIQRPHSLSPSGDQSATLHRSGSSPADESNDARGCDSPNQFDCNSEYEPGCDGSIDPDEPCAVCHRSDDDGKMLLCDSCNSAYHIYCIDLKEVPRGRWLCKSCPPSLVPAPTRCSMESSQRPVGNAKNGRHGAIGGTQYPLDEISPYHELAHPVDLEEKKVWFNKPPILMSQVRREMQWICQAQSGVAFCLHCDCPKAIIPTLNLSKARATHDGIPSFFHTNPFDNHNALGHFQSTHGEQVSTMEEIVTKYGTEVRHDDSLMPTLNKWDIAAHNNSVRLWYQHLLAEWEKLLQDNTAAAAGRLHLEQPDKTVLASSLTDSTYIFPWPRESQQFWAITCSSPRCHQERFTKHPMRNGRNEAISHFKEHGLSLTRTQMLAVFGYKVINDLPGQLISGLHKAPE